MSGANNITFVFNKNITPTGATYGRDTRTSRISGEVPSVGCAKKQVCRIAAWSFLFGAPEPVSGDKKAPVERRSTSGAVIFALRRVILLRSDIRLSPSDIARRQFGANIISL